MSNLPKLSLYILALMATAAVVFVSLNSSDKPVDVSVTIPDPTSLISHVAEVELRIPVTVHNKSGTVRFVGSNAC